ncbi:MAG: glycoside hydrolase family 1 protein [Angustibacter sp.]
MADRPAHPRNSPTGRRFPASFQFGAATSAYQIEGAATQGGRTPSIWDTFAHTPGAVDRGEHGDVTCDHYHRFRQDVALMRQLGLTSYRFSVAWPRITPHVRLDDLGPVNREGIGFYQALVRELVDAGITPVATLYHWDLPQALQDAGGWTHRATVERFAEYAALVAGELSPLVTTFITLNEPWCIAYLGHASGEHAPGLRDGATALTVVHHCNLAHGLAVRAIRDTVPAARIGLALNLHWVRPPQTYPPHTRSAESVLADPTAADTTTDNATIDNATIDNATIDQTTVDGDLADAVRRVDGLTNRVFLDPVLHGRYPQDVLNDTAAVTDWSFVQDGDLALIQQPLDLLGLNYYTPMWVRLRPQGTGRGSDEPTFLVAADDLEVVDQPAPHTGMGWGINPRGLRELLLRLHRESPGTDLVVSENGAAYPDLADQDGTVHDPDRIAYLHQHLDAVLDAVDAGAPVRAYYLWSLLDNFEWARGYRPRFGITYVDFATQHRTLKDSAHWYAAVIRHHALEAPV